MKIMIVDDAKVDIVILRSHLRKVGYTHVVTATSAEEMFQIFNDHDGEKSQGIDLILMDVEMPGMSGIEACRQIKLTEKTKDIPVIIVTGKIDNSSFKLALGAGALDFIQKPVREGELLARVHSALKLKHETDTRKSRERDLLEANRMLKMEREKSEKLLSNILPDKIAMELKYKGKAKPELYKDVTIYFSDIVRFTKLSAMLDPESLIDELNDMFTAFDDIMEKYQCERIKTIGDAYLAVCGISRPNPDHALNMVKAGIEAIEYINNRNKNTLIQWKIRVGIHSGDVVGSVVGVKKYLYDIFGDAVNTASRMETYSEPMKITISEETHDLVKHCFQCVERPPMMIKGKGKMKTYFVEGPLNNL